ncbi:ferrochelatase [Stenotrophobium rhamnosiphilum]|nr:ferrochelatase [Stenotrophobium rhamnosiphilum]
MMHNSKDKAGVLLVNLGTPDAPTAPAIRRYLREFLSDTRVVEIPRAVWLPVLYGFILPFRPKKLAHAYASVWSERGSPLLAVSKQQAQQLQTLLGADVPVALGMTYGNPSVASALAELKQKGATRIVVLPLYPQYSGTTTASVFDAIARVLARERHIPELRTINDYHAQPAYIEALAASVRAYRQTHGASEHLLMSFHSIPQRYVNQGDPYDAQCKKTAALLAEALQLKPEEWSISFQSRLGREPWLQPYTDVVLPQYAAKGIKTLDVICPGFSADCLETLEEVAIRYREDFLAAGGEGFRYIPALNADDAHIRMMQSLVQSAL